MIRSAAERLCEIVVRTPLIRSDELSEHAGVDVWLKCENLQRTGSFKLRGAYNALATLSAQQRSAGVVASSAGNHGLGVAHAAHALGIRARIFLPTTAPAVKRDGIIALGADVDSSQPHYDAAHDAALRLAHESGMTFVNPCGGTSLLAGQGTVGLEILDALPALRTIIVPVGGGGLVGGIGALMRAERPDVAIIGAQSENTDAMARSLAAGMRVDVDVPPTLADGLAGQIDDEGMEIGRQVIDRMVVVSEDAIAEAIAWLARAHDMKVEGSGAVGIAAMRSIAPGSLSGPVAIVLSGSNIDDARFHAIVRDTRSVAL
jgi:threonine dehydratase